MVLVPVAKRCHLLQVFKSPLLLHWLHSSRVILACLYPLFLTSRTEPIPFLQFSSPRIDVESAGVLFQTEVNRWVSRICADTLLLENCLPLLPGHQNVANTIALAVTVGRHQDVKNEWKLANPRYLLLWS